MGYTHTARKPEGAIPLGYVHERAKPDTLPPRSRPVRNAMGYSARKAVPADGRMPTTESGVPPLDLQARKAYYARVEQRRLAREREGKVPPRPPKPPLSLGPPREEAIWWHCVREAKREIDALSTGEVYRWVPYREQARPAHLLDPSVPPPPSEKVWR